MANQKSAVRAFCAEAWPEDYKMQEFCIKEQTESAVELDALFRRYPEESEPARIIGRCVYQWTKRDERTDYKMAVFCANEQLQAYERLQRQ
jgi:hypothetical protein